MNLAGVLLIALVAPDTAGEALTTFRKMYQRPASLDTRVERIQKLARHKDPRVAKIFATLLVREKMEVRIVIARSLAGFGGVKGVDQSLVTALDHRANKRKGFLGVRVSLLKAMGSVGGRKVVSMVNSKIEDEDPWIAKAAIISAGQLRSASSVGLLVRALKRLEGPSKRRLLPGGPLADDLPPNTFSRIIGDAGPTGEDGKPAPTRERLLAGPLVEALKSITREEYEYADTWSEWWSKNHRTFKVPK